MYRVCVCVCVCGCDTELHLDLAQQTTPDVWLMGYQELASTTTASFSFHYLVPISKGHDTYRYSMPFQFVHGIIKERNCALSLVGLKLMTFHSTFMIVFVSQPVPSANNIMVIKVSLTRLWYSSMCNYFAPQTTTKILLKDWVTTLQNLH